MVTPKARFRGARLTCLSAKAGTGIGTTIDVRDYSHIVIEVSSASSANATIKFQGSDDDAAPAFGSTPTTAIPWDYIGANLLDDGTVVEGDTGHIYAGTDGVHLYMLNVDAISWFNMNVTARSAGNVTSKVRGYMKGD